MGRERGRAVALQARRLRARVGAAGLSGSALARGASCALALFLALAPVQLAAPWAEVGWAEPAFALGAALWALAARRGAVRPGPIGLEGAAALAYLALACAAALAHGTGGLRVLGIAELVGVMLLVRAAGRDERARDRLLIAWTWGAALWSAVGLFGAAAALLGHPLGGLFVGGGELDLAIRPAGVCRSGMLATYALPPLVILSLDGARLVGPRARPALLVLLGGTIALTLTRTLLAAVAALPLALVVRGVRSRRWALAALAPLLALALLSVRLDLHGEGGRFTLTAAPGIRWRIARSALATAAAHPLLGAGPAAAPAVVGWPREGDPPQAWDAHATPLDVAATLGFPALVAFTCVLAAAGLRRPGAWGDAPPAAQALAVALGAVAFDALTIDLEDARHLWVLVGLVAARGRLSG